MHNADNGHYVLFGLCVAATALSTVRLHRLPSSLTVAPVKRMGCVDLMPVGCCVWVWVGPRGLFASSGGPCRVVRRRATLPHPVGCSTIAVPGLSFRVRNGTGRLTWAMAAANLLLYGQTLGSAGLVAAREPDRGRDAVDVSSCGQTMLIAVWCRLQEDDALPEQIGE